MPDKDEKRGGTVSVRFADDELERLRSAADRSGDSVSAHIRKAVLDTSVPRPLIQVGSANVGLSPDVFPSLEPAAWLQASIQVNG
jgi:hypothetical protein